MSLRTSLRAMPDGIQGMGYMLGSASSVSVMNGLVHQLSHSVHVFEIAFIRQFFGIILMSTVFIRHGFRPLVTRHFGLHAVRGILNVGATLAYFSGLSLEPLAKVVSLSLLSPIFASVGAVLILGEKMTRYRWIALIVGLLGAVIILRPGIQEISLGAGLVLLSNALWALALVIIKMLSRTDSSVTITLYAAVLQAPFTLAFAVFVWTWPSIGLIGLMVVMAVLGTVSQLCLSEAFRKADATLVLPVDFTKVIWASLIGFFFFNQVPEIWVGLGAFVVFLAVFYNAYHERRDTMSRKPPDKELGH
jgi:drug/metabolite transporter (DMT)-like permease